MPADDWIERYRAAMDAQKPAPPAMTRAARRMGKVLAQLRRLLAGKSQPEPQKEPSSTLTGAASLERKAR